MISVIIPYNIDRGYLREAMDSVQQQTYTNWELVVAQGSGTLSENLNKGIRKAEGKYIKILSEDDTMPENTLMDLRAAIEGYHWAYGAGICSTSEMDIIVRPEKGITLLSLIKHNSLHGGAVLYRKGLFREGFREDLTNAEEYEFHLRLLSKGIKPGWTSKICAWHRVYSGQKSIKQKMTVDRINQINFIRNLYV